MEKDEWTKGGSIVSSTEHLSRLRNVIENESAVIVEHRFYRGGRAPHRFVSDDFEELEQYIKTQTAAGDSIYFWRFDDCCRDNNVLVAGKVPDEFGQVPKHGTY